MQIPHNFNLQGYLSNVSIAELQCTQTFIKKKREKKIKQGILSWKWNQKCSQFKATNLNQHRTIPSHENTCLLKSLEKVKIVVNMHNIEQKYLKMS